MEKQELKEQLIYFQEEFSLAKQCIEEGKPNKFFIETPSVKGKDGVLILEYPEYSDLMNDFWQLMLENYISYPPEGYKTTPFPIHEYLHDWIAIANLKELKIFLFSFYRTEKFTVGGCWHECIEDGWLIDITKRLSEILEEEIEVEG